MSDDAREAQLAHSWRRNAFAWARVVREERIASRQAGTDAAIVEAVLATRATRVLDVGCGEGWLARALAVEGCDVVGIDASPELVAIANELGGAQFETLSYTELAARSVSLGRFGAAACNFSLLDDDLAPLLGTLRNLLQPGGSLLVQTVHPWIACGNEPYRDGWRVETFAGFGEDFREPMPWFFRTLESWTRALRTAGFTIERLAEPVDPANGRPLSLLIHARSPSPSNAG